MNIINFIILTSVVIVLIANIYKGLKNKHITLGKGHHQKTYSANENPLIYYGNMIFSAIFIGIAIIYMLSLASMIDT